MLRLVPFFAIDKLAKGEESGSLRAFVINVDLAGFTTFTEEIFSDGKGGAETLSLILNDIFSPQVEEVMQAGGWIAGFAGDAFTAIYPCMENPEKRFPSILASAARIIDGFFSNSFRSRLDAHKPIHFIGLRLGLAYGKVEWGMPGTENRRLFFVAGEAVERATTSQEEGRSGFISIDPDTAKRFGTDTLRDYRSHLMNTMPNLKSAESNPAGDPEKARVFLPSGFTADLSAEFRPVSTVFLSVPTQDALNFASTILSTAESYGGFVAKLAFLKGNGLFMIVFGAPLSLENNPLSAARFLFECRRQLDDIEWRAGVADGTVYAGTVGSANRSEYTVIGDSVNVAARVAYLAGANDIFASAAFVDQLKGEFSNENALVLEARGHQAPVEVKRLTGHMAGAAQHFRTAFVGRAREQMVLSTFIRNVMAGRSGTRILIEGEAGVGKTRLVRETLDRLSAGGFTYVCASDPIYRGSLHPLGSFVRQFFSLERDENFATLGDLVERLAPFLPSVEPKEAEKIASIVAHLCSIDLNDEWIRSLNRENRVRTLARLFERILSLAAERGPMLLVFEDAQWMDDETISWLSAVENQDSKTGFVFTARTESPHGLKPLFPPGSTILKLGELKNDELAHLVAALTERLPSTSLVNFMQERTQGNPLFTEQLTDSLMEREMLQLDENGLLDIVDEARRADIPHNLSALLIARLDRLEPELKNAVFLASVLGRNFDVLVLATMLKGRSDIATLIRKGIEARVWVVEQGGLAGSFTHALICDMAYQMQMGARLKEIHSLAAQSLIMVYAAEPFFDQIAYHLDRAERPLEAYSYYMKAGKAAAAHYAHSDATAFYSRACELVNGRNDAKTVAALLERTRIDHFLGHVAEEEEGLARLATFSEHAALETGILIDILLLQAEVAQGQDMEAALDLSRRAVDLAKKAKDIHRLSHSLYRLGLAQTQHNAFDEAMKSLTESRSLAKDDMVLNVRISIQIGTILSANGEMDQSQAMFADALDLARKIGDREHEATALTGIGAIWMNRNRFEEACEEHRRARVIYESIGDAEGMGYADMQMAISLRGIGRWEEAIRHYERCATSYEKTTAVAGILFSYMDRAPCYIPMGRYEAARDILDLILPQALEHKLETLFEWTSVFYGITLIRLGEIEKSERISLEVLDRKQYSNYMIRSFALDHLGLAAQVRNEHQKAVGFFRSAIENRISMKKLNLAAESRCHLSASLLALGKKDEALLAIDECYDELMNTEIPGSMEPITCYALACRTLRESDDPRREVLGARACALFRKYLDLMEDPVNREAYLAVEAHQEIGGTCGA